MSIGLALAALAIALPLPTTTPTPPVPLLGAHATQQAEETAAREWSANRPGRGTTGMTRTVMAAAEFPPSITAFAACVIRRESGGNLIERQSGVRAYNPSGAQGRWQFLQSWNHGGPYMVRDRLVQFGMSGAQAREIREHLSSMPILRWHGLWQDVLFIEVMERGGRDHWDGPGC